MKDVFIHIPKAGGMSIRHSVVQDKIVVHASNEHKMKSPEYAERVKAHMASHNEHHGLGHARWRDIRKDLQELDAFAIVRNPWDRVVSRYCFGQVVAHDRRPDGSPWVIYPVMTFEEFLEERFRWGTEPYYWHRAVRGWYLQRDYVTDEMGKLRCAVMRCEHLDEDLKAYRGWVLPPVRRNAIVDRQPYREVYNKHTLQIVADWYARDIDYFGFDYDTPATRNVMACKT